MKTGKTITELAQEIERQAAAKRDLVADTRALTITPGLKMHVQAHEFSISPLAHRQIGEHVGIPKAYYDRMMETQPELLAQNVNTWFTANGKRRLVRLLDNHMRSFLSDRYQRIDNLEVAQTVLPILMSTPGLEVVSSEITESRLYIKAINRKNTLEVKSRRVGDFVQSGVMISNSEVGLGALTVKPFFEYLICTNGMVRDKDSMRRAHLGRQIEGDNVSQFLTDETRKAEDHAVLLKVRDVMAAAMDPDAFRAALDAMQAITEDKIEGNPVAAVEELRSTFALSDAEGNSILRHLIEGADLTRYGLMNAMTRASQDVDSYDRATEMETFGGGILDMPTKDWNRIAVAA